jgi:choline dehydrogenase-like flavoprotein
MADTAEGGVVDALGHVFDTTSGDVRTDLYIADGSAIPTALGVNPSLTISAVALRTADHIVGELRAADRVRAPAEATIPTEQRASHGPG